MPLGPIGAFCVSRLFEPTMAAGGSKSLANGLFRVAARAGARCLVSTRVVALEPAGETWTLRLADRRKVRAGAVVSTLDPLSTFGELLAPTLQDRLSPRSPNTGSSMPAGRSPRTSGSAAPRRVPRVARSKMPPSGSSGLTRRGTSPPRCRPPRWASCLRAPLVT